MASHRRPKQPSRARVTVLTSVAAAAVALTSQAAQADPKPNKKEVKAQVDDLYHEAEVVNEQHNAAKEKQEKLAKQVGALQDKVARGQAELNKMRNALGALAAAQYRTGGIDPSVQLFLSSDPDGFLDKASTVDQISAKQAEALRTVQEKQRTLAQQRKEATGKLAELEKVRKEMGAKKRALQTKLGAAQKLLNTLTAQERAAIKQDEQRASRDAGDRVELGNEVPASQVGAAAMAKAATQVGKPYRSGFEGPDAYDCSGLTQWAFAQVNVHISRVTYTQQNDGPKVGRSELRPGDLVFFNGLSHVGFYAGNNQVLHAPKPGASVRYESMDYLGTFQFGVRIGG